MSVSNFHVNDVDGITAYFGPEIGYYFEFMQFYVKMLRCGAIIGTSLHFHGLLLDGPKVDDNPFFSLYGLFVIFWGAVLCICWRRQSCIFAYRHGLLRPALYAPPDSHRPGFWGSKRISPITGEVEIHFPWQRYFLKYVVSSIVTSLFLAVALFCMMCSMNAQEHVDAVGISKTLYMPTLAKLSQKGGTFSRENTPFWGFIPRHLIITLLHVAAIKLLNTVSLRSAIFG